MGRHLNANGSSDQTDNWAVYRVSCECWKRQLTFFRTVFGQQCLWINDKTVKISKKSIRSHRTEKFGSECELTGGEMISGRAEKYNLNVKCGLE